MSEPSRQIKTRMPFPDEMDGGAVDIEVKSNENGAELWLRQGNDAFCLSFGDWAKLKKCVDATITAYENLEAGLYESEQQ